VGNSEYPSIIWGQNLIISFPLQIENLNVSVIELPPSYNDTRQSQQADEPPPFDSLYPSSMNPKCSEQNENVQSVAIDMRTGS
jgi:hypothetical protein